MERPCILFLTLAEQHPNIKTVESFAFSLKLRLHAGFQLALLLPLIAVLSEAQSNVANVVATGTVQVNGKNVVRSGTIFDGETLKSGSDGAAAVTSPGLSISSSGYADYKYSPKQLDLECGGTVITTFNGYSVISHGITVRPAEQAAKYQVMQNSKMLRISAIEGTLNVVDSKGGTTPLSPGSMKEFPMVGKCAFGVPAWVASTAFSGLVGVPFIHTENPISASQP